MSADLVIVITLIIANALFTISDMSVIASRKSRLQGMIDNGSQKARSVLKLAENPTAVIATTQIGLTVVTLLEGAFVEAAVSKDVAAYLVSTGYFHGFEDKVASIGVFFLVTFFLILFGDILPKRIAILYPEQVATFLAPLTTAIIRLLMPMVKSFSILSDSILKLFGLETKRDDNVSEDDITTMLEAGAESGVLVKAEKDLFDNVWRLDESKAGALMTPRSEIVFIDVTAPVQDNIDKILSNPSQNLLVCKESLEHVLGYVPAIAIIKEIIQQARMQDIEIKVNWTDGLKPIHNIPNSLTLVEILESFRMYKTHIALVYNEFGHVDGIITLGDLVTAVIGDIPGDINNEGSLIYKDTSGKWIIDGMASVNDMLNELEIDELPDGDTGSYQTAAGFVIAFIGRKFGRLPKVFDKFDFSGFHFEVVDIDRDGGYRVDKIMVSRKEEHSQPESEE